MVKEEKAKGRQAKGSRKVLQAMFPSSMNATHVPYTAQA